MSATFNSMKLLLGLPCERIDFDRRLKGSDYLRRFSMDPQTSWMSTYQPQVAGPVSELVAHARSLGIAVQTEATLTSVLEATTNREIVILFTHWKGYETVREDFISCDPPLFLQRIASCDEPWARWLADRMRNESVPEAVNSYIRSEKLDLDDPHPAGFTVLADPITLRTERRDRIDALFHELLTPGNLLELADALCSRQAVDEHVASTFKGTLDIAACNSSILADYLERSRRSTFRIVQFPEVLDPELSCLALRLAFDLMAEHSYPYLTARIRALEFMREQLRLLVDEARKQSYRWWRRVLCRV